MTTGDTPKKNPTRRKRKRATTATTAHLFQHSLRALHQLSQTTSEHDFTNYTVNVMNRGTSPTGWTGTQQMKPNGTRTGGDQRRQQSLPQKTKTAGDLGERPRKVVQQRRRSSSRSRSERQVKTSLQGLSLSFDLRDGGNPENGRSAERFYL